MADQQLRTASFESWKCVIAAIGGDQVTLGMPDKDAKNIAYSKMVEFIKSGRVNVELSTQLQIRKAQNMLPTQLQITELDGSVLQDLEAFFDPNPDAAHVEKCWKLFKDVQSLSRGDWGAMYYKNKKAHKSGVYSDVTILVEIVRKNICDGIDENYGKWVSSQLVAWKKLDCNKNSTQEMVRQQQIKLGTEKKEYYTGQKTNWQQNKIPIHFLAFLFLGPPGAELVSLAVQAKKEVIVKGKGGRHAMQGIKGIDSLNDSDVAASGSSDVGFKNQAITIKKQEVILKAKVVDRQTVEDRKRNLREIINEFKEMGDENEEECKNAKADLLNLLRGQISKPVELITESIVADLSSSVESTRKKSRIVVDDLIIAAENTPETP
jgi:hypothetical protein